MINAKVKKILKNILFSFAHYLGIFYFFRMLYNRRGFVPVLVYHRVTNNECHGKASSSFKLRGLAVSRLEFEKQVRYLRRRYKIISLSDYIKKKENQQRLSGCAVITFDDGFRDFKYFAQPILKKYRAQTTLFIFTEALRRIHWQHLAYLILDEAKQEFLAFSLKGNQSLTINLKNDKNKYKTIRHLIQILENIPQGERGEIMDRLAEGLGVTKEFKVQEVYLEEGELKELIKEGVSLGAHSVTHRKLPDLQPEEFREEIVSSLTFIKNLTNQQDIAFVLPFGARSRIVIQTLRESGAFCNFSNLEGLNSPTEDNFRLKRIVALDNSWFEFAYHVSGTKMFLRYFSLAIKRGYKRLFLSHL